MSPAIPMTLANAIKQGSLVPFVGAGVSMAVKTKTGTSKYKDGRAFPSWKELLLEAADRLDGESRTSDARLVRAYLDIDPADYVAAAKQVKKGLIGRVWSEFVNEALGVRANDVDQNSLELARAVWGLGCELVVTTNYDRVLRWACPNPSDLQIWNVESVQGHVASMRGVLGRSTLWHLHGNLDDIERMILASEDYNELYRHERYRVALKHVHDLLISKTVLFIGFSLDDPYFLQVLGQVHDIFRGFDGPHYALIPEWDAKLLEIRLQGLHVRAIPISNYGLPYLEYLQALAAVR